MRRAPLYAKQQKSGISRGEFTFWRLAVYRYMAAVQQDGAEFKADVGFYAGS